MATESQIAANKANAQHSTGPKTEAGLRASSVNNFRHGLAGKFMVLPWEKAEEFAELFENLRAEHQPSTATEALLVERMAQHYWLSQRSLRLQDECFSCSSPECEDKQMLALYLRYQSTHERGFHKCLNDLLKLRAERRKQEIGFELQQAKLSCEQHRLSREQQRLSRERERAESRQAAEARKEAAENRKQQLHKFAVLLAQAKLDNQALQNLQFDTENPLVFAATKRIMEAEKAA